MAHFRGGDRPFSSIHKILKMLLSPHSSNKPNQDTTTGMTEDVDEPPDNSFHPSAPMHCDNDNAVVYVKSSAAASAEHKESLLTRALRNSTDLSPTEPHSSAYDNPFSYRSYPHSNVSGISTAELTSDGGMTTSPSLSNTPSPPAPSHMPTRPDAVAATKKDGPGTGESTIEANLGRKRCISFACGRKAEDQQKPQQQQQQQQQSQQAATSRKPIAEDTNGTPTPTEPVKRKTMLTFVCPGRESQEPTKERSPARKMAPRSTRPRGSPAPLARKASPTENQSSAPVDIPQSAEQKAAGSSERIGVPTKGLGKFEESEATRFHEFASSVEEDDEWVKKAAEYTEKITMNDCMKKEIAIRKLGEEAEKEALEDEDDDDDDDDDEDDEDSEDDDASTLHDSDDGNESDNEAGFADSDESDVGSEYDFWAPSTTTAATSPQTVELPGRPFKCGSYNSFDSREDGRQNFPPSLTEKHSPGRQSKAPRMRPGTPHLPDSTDFVCGTLDEDRPLEVAYKSCIEQRRLSKQVIIPQDIDPSFPTSDPEDEDDDDEDEVEESVTEEAIRGRSGAIQTRRPSPRPSPPKRMVSPPPPRQGRSSPKRFRSPPPPAMKMKLPCKVDQDVSTEAPALHPHGLNISGLVQRPSITRTKSLPRTPNPFFANLERLPRWSGNHVSDPSECESSRTRETHARGPIDIVEGLEKKRQKRKEKFWRQHCRKAAKEQKERRPIPGKGAERMKELGLEVAERCRAYGVGEDAQLVLSV